MPKNTDAVEIEIPEPSRNERHSSAPDASAIPARPKTVQAKSAQTPSRNGEYISPGAYAYTPATSFITRVEVHPWHTDYSYYEQFRAAALKLRDYTGEACPCVPFFSYMPQYSQMSPAQLSYYLYLRSEIENGRYPEADYSYLLLLVYEIINLSDVSDPAESVRTLCSILAGYGDEHPRLCVQLADWICDFCLINRCLPDVSLIAPFMNELISNAFLSEFYVGLDGNSGKSAGFLRLIGGYDYTRSRFASGENRAIYDKHINGVLKYILADKEGRDFFNNTLLEKTKVMRDAYVGALCSPRIKKRFVIEYYSFSRSYKLRFAVRDIQKYTENRLRASMGLRSRLSHGDLPPVLLKLAEKYCSQYISVSVKRTDEAPEYEKLYEPEKTELSLSAATEIEALSWDTTEKLCEAFTDGGAAPDEGKEEAAGTPEKTADTMPGPEAQKCGNACDTMENENERAEREDASGEGLVTLLSSYELAFLKAALDGDAASERAVCKGCGVPQALMADRINEAAAELYDDVILEEKDGSFSVIEDYADSVRGELAE